MHWATIITSTGALLGGLAIVIAFIQLGRQREDQLRAQVSKIGVWAEKVALQTDRPEWQITLFIQNASELPVEVHVAQLAIDTVGYKDLRPKRIGFVKSVRFYPGTIPPGSKWQDEQKYAPDKWPAPDVDSSSVTRTRIGIQRLAITDAAGRKWEVRPYRGRPPRRVRWRRGWPTSFVPPRAPRRNY